MVERPEALATWLKVCVRRALASEERGNVGHAVEEIQMC